MTEPDPDDDPDDYWDLVAGLDESVEDDPDQIDYRNGWPPKA